MRDIVDRTELCCLLTYLNHDYCIDHIMKPLKKNSSLTEEVVHALFVGASPKIVIAI